MTRLTLAAAAVAVAATLAPSSSAAAGCPNGFYARGTGVVSPLSGREVTYCWPIWPAA